MNITVFSFYLTYMNITKQLLLFPLLAAILVSLNSAVSQSFHNHQQTLLSPDGFYSLPATNTKAVESQNTTTVTIYTADSQCAHLIPQTINVSKDRVLVEAVGRAIAPLSTADFELTGYRVNVDRQLQLATIDFRLAPNSRRRFISLSPCEQFALFASLRKTLTENTHWQIRDVRFTQRGEPLQF